MNTNTKKALILATGALAGVVAGRWATPKVGNVVGLAFGRWGSVVGARSDLECRN